MCNMIHRLHMSSDAWTPTIHTIIKILGNHKTLMKLAECVCEDILSYNVFSDIKIQAKFKVQSVQSHEIFCSGFFHKSNINRPKNKAFE
jgi:hypothetical protein